MIVGVPKEAFPRERRVALVPVVVPTLIKAGFEVLVEAAAGESAGYRDSDYVEKGARLASRSEVFQFADTVAKVLSYGANDVANPAKRDQSSPIFGRPIREFDKALTVMVIKRSMNPGFAEIDNPLYYFDKTLMLFGDAKGFVGDIVRELTGGSGH